jgi:SPP1 gp7 family putative phage head morphogenesis protein
MAELNNKPWEQVQKYLDSLEDSIEKQSLIIHKKALSEIRGVLLSNFERFASGETLTRGDLYRSNRLRIMEEEITAIINTMAGTNLKSISGSLSGLFTETLNTTYFATGKQLQIDLGVPPLDPKLVEARVMTPIVGIKLSETLEKHRLETIMNIKRTLGAGMVQEKPLRDLSKDLSNEFGFTYEKSRRIARTESGRVRSAALLEGMKQLDERLEGGLMKRWLSAKDSRTRKSHRKLDGVTVPVNENFVSEDGNIEASAPGHFLGSGSAKENINCRCTMITFTDDHELARMRTRDINTGRSKVERYKTYTEWAKANGLK